MFKNCTLRGPADRNSVVKQKYSNYLNKEVLKNPN